MDPEVIKLLVECGLPWPYIDDTRPMDPMSGDVALVQPILHGLLISVAGEMTYRAPAHLKVHHDQCTEYKIVEVGKDGLVWFDKLRALIWRSPTYPEGCVTPAQYQSIVVGVRFTPTQKGNWSLWVDGMFLVALCGYEGRQYLIVMGTEPLTKDIHQMLEESCV